MATVNLEFPAELVAQFWQGDASKEATRLLALELYRLGRVSFVRSAELCSMPLSDFTEFAAHRGVSPLHHDVAPLQDEDLVMQWMADAKREEEVSPKSTKEILAESRRLARSVQQRAKKLGIDTSDASIVKMIHELRAENDA